MDSSLHQAPPSMGFSRQEVLEWVAISFSRESSQSRDQTQVSHTVDRHLLSEPPGKSKAVTNPAERAASAKIRETGKLCCVQERKS